MHATWSLVSSLYHPSECQVLTLALDAQLCYWEVIDGKEIRHLVLGKHSTVTALDVSHDGESFITATDSSLIKVSFVSYRLYLQISGVSSHQTFLVLFKCMIIDIFSRFGSINKVVCLEWPEHIVVQSLGLSTVQVENTLLLLPNMVLLSYGNSDFIISPHVKGF